ncbi:hypothetical protein EKL30_09930 [Candidimonas sp. SYP-B2681]|uniref:hypothetical protein n=1 Tax=Candidimonas sp. SYP-B2681 TaxID=2497686 RepID=UPI000F86BF6C|nr:hypothetical protein [Candidimonas sp. SYP-B2681]RTZ43193.1 hypothetical protein EKL30_09930 [Candidimonas sp. SYP-B2681]
MVAGLRTRLPISARWSISGAVIIALLVFIVGALWLQGKPDGPALQGGCDPKMSPFLQQEAGDYRISFCAQGDGDQLEISTDYFSVEDRLVFSYAGYPNMPGMFVFLEAQDGSRFDLELTKAGENWRRFSAEVPEGFRNVPVRLVVQDTSPEAFSWVGIGHSASSFVNISGLFLLIATVIGVHIAFLTWLSMAQRMRSPDVASLVFIIGLGLLGYLAFWAYYLHRWAGVGVSALALLASMQVIFLAVRRNEWEAIKISNKALMPATAYALFILLVGYFPFHDLGSNFTIAANRWMHLAIDNWIPRIFAEQVWAGTVQAPMVGDWFSSDRPPLQSGIYLLFYPLAQSGLLYQVVSSMLQALVFLPICVLLKRFDARLAPIALLALGLTSLISVHVLYVWPKLISASYQLILFLLALTALGRNLSRASLIVMMGSAMALAMLSHGGAIFGLLAIVIAYLVKDRSAAIIPVIKAGIASLILYSPWMLYQRFIDPPGDRLLKWHLAGMIEPNTLSFSNALVSAYQGINFETWIAGRLENLNVIANGTMGFLRDFFSAFVDPLRALQIRDDPMLVGRSFFETFYSFWWFSPVLVLGLWFLLRGHRRTVPADLIWFADTAILSALVCALLLFMPGTASIHQGSFYTWIAFFVSSAALLWLASRLAFKIILALNAAIFFHFYVFDKFWLEPAEFGLTYLAMSIAAFIFFAKACFALQEFDAVDERRSSPEAQPAPPLLANPA